MERREDRGGLSLMILPLSFWQTWWERGKGGGRGRRKEGGGSSAFVLHSDQIYQIVNLFPKACFITKYNKWNLRLETILLLKLYAPKSRIIPYQVEGKKGIDFLACSYSVPFWGVRGARLCPAVSGRVWPIPFSSSTREFPAETKQKFWDLPNSFPIVTRKTGRSRLGSYYPMWHSQ